MAVIINTNSAATLAAANLAASSAGLHRSLNRLSSGSRIVNPADDAGGLAVAMKLAAAEKRQAAIARNVGNTISFLQTQDGVLSSVRRVLERIGELKTLNEDPTKNTSDTANYQAEFATLQAQLNASAGEKFNGVSLFGTSSLTVITADGATGMQTSAVDLMQVPPFAGWADDFDDFSNWTSTAGTGGVSGNVLLPNTGGGYGAVESNSTVTGAFTVEFDLYIPGTGDFVETTLAGETLSNLQDLVNISKWAWNSVRVVFDGAGNASTYLNNSSTPADTRSGISATTGALGFGNLGGGSASIRNFQVTSSEPAGNVATVAGAASLSAMSLGTLTNAINDVAEFRAGNGAVQNNLSFSAELLTVNRANIGAAASRISDVDVAAESTVLARYNVLVQAGTAMLAQANQSPSAALRLLT